MTFKGSVLTKSEMRLGELAHRIENLVRAYRTTMADVTRERSKIGQPGCERVPPVLLTRERIAWVEALEATAELTHLLHMHQHMMHPNQPGVTDATA